MRFVTLFWRETVLNRFFLFLRSVYPLSGVVMFFFAILYLYFGIPEVSDGSRTDGIILLTVVIVLINDGIQAMRIMHIERLVESIRDKVYTDKK